MSVITGGTRQEVMAKAILAACKPCGCGGSGSGSGHVSRYGLSCCSNTIQYSGFCITISGGTWADGTYTMTYQTGVVITRTWSGFPCSPTDTLANGWFSEWQPDARNPCTGLSVPIYRHRVWIEESAIPGVGGCIVNFSFETGTGGIFCTSERYISSGILFLTRDSLSCSPLVITYHANLSGPVCGAFPPTVVGYGVLTEC